MSERASKSPRAREARHPNPACPRDEASNLPPYWRDGAFKSLHTRDEARTPPGFTRDRVNPCYFVVLRSEIGSFDEIAWTKSRNDGPLKIGKLLTWDFSWMDVEAEIESAPEPCYLVKSDKKHGKKRRDSMDSCRKRARGANRASQRTSAKGESGVKGGRARPLMGARYSSHTAHTRAGRPDAPSIRGHATKIIAPAGGTLSKLAMTST